MIGREQPARWMKRHGIVELKMEAEVAAEALRVFHERCEGLLEVAWYKHGWTPEKLKEAFEQYGLDCYMQGCVDGATTAMMQPELVETMRASSTVSGSLP